MQPEHRDLASLDTLGRVANDLAGEFRLEPLLELILRSSVRLLDCESGSLCLVDQHTQTYRKQIDMEAGCQAGRVFPLDEGVTGAVVRAGRPVMFRRYADVPGGHVSQASPLYRRAVLGVPIRSKSDFIGSLVVFAADDEHEFGDADGLLLQRFATHAAIAMANARLHAEAAERAKEAAVWAERERSMLDVHDALGRGLATVLLQLDQAQELAREGRPVVEMLQAVKETAESVLRDGRRAVWGLPEEGDGRSLEEALALELEWTEAIAGVATSLRVFGDPQPLRPETATQLVRIVKESLTNVAQHADANTVRLGLVYQSEGVAVIVEDDGRGFDPDERSAGVGLSGLVSRATQVGGRVQLDSTPGWGTRVRADLPYRGTIDDVPEAPRLRVVVVHDQPAMRAGIVRLLDHSEPGVQVVAEIGETQAAADAVRLLRPAVVLTGSRMSRTGGANLVAALHAVDPELPVVVVMDEDSEQAMREWASSGVRGIVPGDADATALGRAVVAAAQGDVLVFSGILQRLDQAPAAGTTNLTAREREVLDLLHEGLADKQIASRLGISVKTVEKHVGAVFRKRGVHSRIELLAQA